MKLSFEDYKRIRDFIYRQTGIMFDDKKMFYIKKRLDVRINDTGAVDYVDYFRDLRFCDPQRLELQALVNLLTTNETYFFREFEQLASFAEHCLQETCQAKRKLGRWRLRLWSAGCSTGEEPYTLAIILREMLEDFDDWNITIYGTDINTRVLETAQHAVYEQRAVKDVPPEYLAKWFTSTSEKRYRVQQQIKNTVEFERVNLKNPAELTRFSDIDFVFCRNVLIYFDNESRAQVVSSFHDCLNPGGYIFLGHSESLSRITGAFRLRRKGDSIVYQKPDQEGK
ncbi:MAG: protein-glutamate O-methyltransferase CheR [Deltaproteobacteria bacterium]|nr:protein-glutamate O-methyltransferase CheR [Deltaproteobacteria bacterium]